MYDLSILSMTKFVLNKFDLFLNKNEIFLDKTGCIQTCNLSQTLHGYDFRTYYLPKSIIEKSLYCDPGINTQHHIAKGYNTQLGVIQVMKSFSFIVL